MADKKEKRYVSDNAQLMTEWNWEQNNEFGYTPQLLTLGSNRKVWWKCKKGHEWQAKISNRNNGNGCPVCNSERHTSFPEYALAYYLRKYGIEVLQSYKGKGYELDVYIPSKEIAIEYDGYYWHRHKIDADLRKNAKCERDGIRLYRIREGLPSLSSTSIDYSIQKSQDDLPKVLKEILVQIVGADIDIDIDRDTVAIENLREHTEKESSILFTNPEIAVEWNPERNGKLKSEHFLANSHKKVWWKCRNGHEWQSTIANRNKNVGCPYCAGLLAIKGETDLITKNPSLAREWNYEKNIPLMPDNFTTSSGKKVWWKCSKGHEWQARIADRTNERACPYCSGRYAVTGENDLQTVNPALAEEWNYKKNGGLTPSEVMPNSDKKVWWKCKKGHEWQAVIRSRNSGCGCPYCFGHRTITGENDLQTVNPNVAKEWDYEKNHGLTPADVMPNSNKKVWWKCKKGHEWQAQIYNRNNGGGCPYCSGKKVQKGFNDLQTVNSTLAKEWNYERNGNLSPENFTVSSGAKVWWKCSKNHEWQATIDSRNSGYGCPFCSGRYVIKGENDLKAINPAVAEEWNYEKNNELGPEDVKPNSHKKVWWKCVKGHEWQAPIYSRNSGNKCPLCAKEKRNLANSILPEKI